MSKITDNNRMGIDWLKNLPVGTVSIGPAVVDFSSWCQGELVRLVEKVAYDPITTIETARMVARNLAPSGKSVAIVRVRQDDNSDLFSVYTLSHDIENFYYKEDAEIFYSTFHKMGQRLPSGTDIVEIYNSSKTPYVQTDVDTTPLHRYPTVGDKVVCLNNGIGNFRKIVNLRSERIVGNRVFYAYHSVPPRMLNAESGSTYGPEPNLRKMDANDFAAMAYFIEMADTAEKIIRLDIVTLVAAGPTQRAKMLRTVLQSEDLKKNEKGVLVVTLFKSIPQQMAGRDSRSEIREVTSNLIEKGLMNEVWSVCDGPLEDLLLLTLKEKGAPDNIFSPENLPLEAGKSFFEGVVGWAGDIFVGVWEFAKDPLHMAHVIAETPLQYFSDRLAIATGSLYNCLFYAFYVDREDLLVQKVSELTTRSSRRAEALESVVSSMVNAKIDAYNAAWDLGVGELYGMELAGRISPDIALMVYPGLKKFPKDIALASRSVEAQIIYQEAGRLVDAVKRWGILYVNNLAI